LDQGDGIKLAGSFFHAILCARDQTGIEIERPGAMRKPTNGNNASLRDIFSGLS
jgi:hypothetical protein